MASVKHVNSFLLLDKEEEEKEKKSEEPPKKKHKFWGFKEDPFNYLQVGEFKRHPVLLLPTF